MNILFYFISFLFSLLFFDKNTVNREYRDYNISSDTLLFPKAKHREQSKLIFQLLSKYHYKKDTVDDSLSVKILEKKLSHIKKPITLSIIGCVVNGPGEAAQTDIGLTGGGEGNNLFFVAIASVCLEL